jgi:hypothetical protein
MVENNPREIYKIPKNSRHSGRRKKGSLMRLERNRKIYLDKQIKKLNIKHLPRNSDKSVNSVMLYVSGEDFQDVEDASFL